MPSAIDMADVRTALAYLVAEGDPRALPAVRAIACPALADDELARAWRDACARARLLRQLKAGERDHADVGNFGSRAVAIGHVAQAAADALDVVLDGPSEARCPI